MKKLFFIAPFFLLFTVFGFSKGTVKESLKFESKLMGQTINYSVYLPEGYDTSTRSYPVVYLLHGFSDDETGWIQFGDAPQIADKEIESGEFPASIIIMPDGKVSWYCNDYKMANPWEDMFVKEFIPYIESTYRIRAKKEFRAISGLSMGGYGSLMLSMRYPDLFSSCAAISSGTFTDEEIISMPDDTYNRYFKDLYGKNLSGNQRLSENWKSHSPLYLLHSVSKEKLNTVRFSIDCGDDDFLYQGNSQLHIEMRKLGISHEYRVRDGSHSWAYFRSGLVDGLKFIGQKFHR